MVIGVPQCCSLHAFIVEVLTITDAIRIREVRLGEGDVSLERRSVENYKTDNKCIVLPTRSPSLSFAAVIGIREGD